MHLPVMPPIAPMLAKSIPEIPPDHYYEPKWDGFRSIVFRDGDEVQIGSRNQRPMERYFPDIVAAVQENLPERCVLDGEIVVPSPDNLSLDFFALQQRIHPAASRIRLLAEQTPASFIAFDLLALDNVDYMRSAFRERRAALEEAFGSVAAPVHITPITQDQDLAGKWFDIFEGAGIDGLIAKTPEGTYEPDKRVMSKIKHVRTADCVVAGFRVHKSHADAIGSLLLGLYAEPGMLMPVGVVGAFTMARRRELFAELQPLVTNFEAHPWRWTEEVVAQARKGEASRWNPTKDLSFIPLRPERVVEVRYDYMEGVRFRHTAQFVRWRPDRDPESCGYEQLETPSRLDLAEVLAGRAT